MKTDVLGLLDNARIFSIEKRDSNFVIVNGCEEVFNLELTKKEIIDLCDELLDLVERPKNG